MKIFKFIISSMIICILGSIFSVFPETTVLADENKPSIVGKSAITMDLETGEIIYAKDIDTKRYPASITKLMTALLFAENATKADKIPFTTSASIQPEYSLSANYGPITIGDTLSGEHTMKALLLFSANDAAYMIGDFISGSNEEFMKLMNKKAKDLGLTNTNFTNPNGLHDVEHYTTAHDLAKMAKAMLENEWVKEAMSTKEAQIQFDNSGKRINIENRNKLLGVDGNIGGKTGYTEAAGRCLLSFYQRDGRTILGIVLNSEYGATDTQVFEDMDAIIDYSFASTKVKYKEKGQQIAQIEAPYKTFGFFGKEKSINIPVTINSDISKYDNGLSEKDIILNVDTKDMSAWKIAGNNNLKVLFSEKGSNIKLTASASLSNFNIIKANLLYYVIRIGAILLILFLLWWTIRTIKNKKVRRSSFLKRRKNTIFK